MLRLLTFQGARPILFGVGVGTVLALAAMRLLRTAVVGVSLSDPASLAAAAALLCVAGLAATLVPAWRATRGRTGADDHERLRDDRARPARRLATHPVAKSARCERSGAPGISSGLVAYFGGSLSNSGRPVRR